MLKVPAEVVEKDVADPSPKDDAERCIEDHVVGMAAGHWRAGLLDELQEVPIADEDAGEVCQAIPAQLEEAEVERDWGQMEVGPGNRVLIIHTCQRHALPPGFAAS